MASHRGGTLLSLWRLQLSQERHFEAFSSVATVIAARAVLHKQLQSANKLSHEGLLDTQELAKFSNRVNAQMKRLVQSPPFIPLPNAIDVLRQVPWLAESSETTLTYLLEHSYEVHLRKGQVLISEGDALVRPCLPSLLLSSNAWRRTPR